MVGLNSFSERFKYLMDEKKIGQIDVSSIYGFEKAQISKWASGKVVPRRATMQKIADSFGCDIRWLAEGIGEPYPPSKPVTTEYTGEFERRKADKLMDDKLARMERAVFKTQCPGYLDDFFDFIADKYAADKEGVEAFLEETSKTNPKFKDWLKEKKKRGEGSLSDEQQYVQNGE